MSFPRAHIDDEIPIFTQDRQFVERHLTPRVDEAMFAELQDIKIGVLT